VHDDLSTAVVAREEIEQYLRRTDDEQNRVVRELRTH
jgi:hypothetical protein